MAPRTRRLVAINDHRHFQAVDVFLDDVFTMIALEDAGPRSNFNRAVDQALVPNFLARPFPGRLDDDGKGQVIEGAQLGEVGVRFETASLATATPAAATSFSRNPCRV